VWLIKERKLLLRRRRSRETMVRSLLVASPGNRRTFKICRANPDQGSKRNAGVREVWAGIEGRRGLGVGYCSRKNKKLKPSPRCPIALTHTARSRRSPVSLVHSWPGFLKKSAGFSRAPRRGGGPSLSFFFSTWSNAPSFIKNTHPLYSFSRILFSLASLAFSPIFSVVWEAFTTLAIRS